MVTWDVTLLEGKGEVKVRVLSLDPKLALTTSQFLKAVLSGLNAACLVVFTLVVFYCAQFHGDK